MDYLNNISEFSNNYNSTKNKVRTGLPDKSGNFKSNHTWLEISSLSQSIKIKAGIFVENWINHLVSSEVDIKMIDKYISPTSGGREKEMDLVFKKGNVIYCREIKTNIELDTEKLSVTAEKIVNLNSKLTTDYPNYTIDSRVLCPPFYTSVKKEVSRLDSKDIITLQIESLRDFLFVLNGDSITKEQHKDIGSKLGRHFW